MHFSYSLFVGRRISHWCQRWSNANHDINLQSKFAFGNAQNHDLYRIPLLVDWKPLSFFRSDLFQYLRDQRHIWIDLLLRLQRQLLFKNRWENDWSDHRVAARLVITTSRFPPPAENAGCGILRLAHHFSRVRKMKIYFFKEQDAKRNLPTFGRLLEIVGGETQQRFFDTWGLCVVVVVCVCIATSWDLRNAAVGFQAELQSSWCHVCTSDSGFKPALCNRSTQLRTVGSAHYSGAWI